MGRRQSLAATSPSCPRLLTTWISDRLLGFYRSTYHSPSGATMMLFYAWTCIYWQRYYCKCSVSDWPASGALCAENTFFSRATVIMSSQHPVCPFGMADWLNRPRAFIIYTVVLIRKKKCKKSSVATVASSVALHFTFIKPTDLSVIAYLIGLPVQLSQSEASPLYSWRSMAYGRKKGREMKAKISLKR